MQEGEINKEQNLMLPLWLGIAMGMGIAIGVWVGMPKNNTARKEGDKIVEILDLLKNNYVEPLSLDTTTTYTIAKLLDHLDPHSSYVPAEQVAMVQSQLESDFEGVGIEYDWAEDTLYVAYLTPNGPAERHGLQVGDKIIGIDQKIIVGEQKYGTNALFGLLRGKAGTFVKLQILRKSNVLEISVLRGSIQSQSVYGYVLDTEKGIAYLKITKFGEKTDKEFHNTLENLFKGVKIQTVILDVRGNGGGYMEKANRIADEFLKTGDKIVYTKGNQTRYDEQYFATKGGLFEEGKVILLINEGSASASEILAGALQDNDRATVVGRRSYGKGLVQVPFSLSDGGELRLTVAKYYSPSGRCIQRDYRHSKYVKSLSERSERKVFLQNDTTHLQEIFRTKKGKIVYGGGGISPDYEVIDTLKVPKNIKESKIKLLGALYAQNHREELRQIGIQKFIKNWNRNVIGEIAYNEALATYVKAHIAKIIWGATAQIQVENQNDAIIRKALTLLP